MRWLKRGINVGTVRMVHRFLVMPKTINGETRWLEWAYWQERRAMADHGDFWNAEGWLGSDA